ncbi:hypothetical protein R0135_07840 [Congregibacter variabilis]|uniref:Uncharacterized protein n=1 Tax=Congregibacter variabilis TaxID=3081200 RepID=A0ABZ0I7P7_9GAMM|nr:hypothetical protein R0135_07840 [Congregibacter sp. IMCC43200]
MSTDRRKSNRDSTDRRRETRRDVPVWGYVVAITAVVVLLTAFWTMIYS